VDINIGKGRLQGEGRSGKAGDFRCACLVLVVSQILIGSKWRVNDRCSLCIVYTHHDEKETTNEQITR